MPDGAAHNGSTTCEAVAYHQVHSRFVGAIFMSQDNEQSPREWKRVAALVATETDPGKALELARELIRALDEHSSMVLGQVTPQTKKSAA